MADAGGYLPLWTAALEERTDAITSSLWVSFVREHLLRTPNTKLVLPSPALVATIGHAVGDIKYKQLSHVGTLEAEVDHVVTASLDLSDGKMHVATNTTASPPATATTTAAALVVVNQTRAMVTAGCPTPKSTTAPCGLDWGGAGWRRSAKRFEAILSKTVLPFASPVPAQHGQAKWVLVGEPVFEATVRLVARGEQGDGAEDFRGAGIVVSLFYAPPDDTSGGPGWLVTQGFQYFDHVDANNRTRRARVVLDGRLLALKTGGKLTLVISNVALQFVHHYPWVNPIGHAYSVEVLVGGPSGLQATLALPMSSGFADRPAYDTSALEKPYWEDYLQEVESMQKQTIGSDVGHS